MLNNNYHCDTQHKCDKCIIWFDNVVTRFTSALTAEPVFLLIYLLCSLLLPPTLQTKKKIPLLWQLSEVFVDAVTGKSYSLTAFLLKLNLQHGLAHPLIVGKGCCYTCCHQLHLEYVSSYYYWLMCFGFYSMFAGDPGEDEVKAGPWCSVAFDRIRNVCVIATPANANSKWCCSTCRHVCRLKDMGCLTYVVIDCHPCKVYFLSANIGVKRTASPVVNRLPFPPSVSSSSPSPGLPLSLSPSSCLPMGRAQSSEVFWLMELYGWHSGRLLHCQFPGCPEKLLAQKIPSLSPGKFT